MPEFKDHYSESEVTDKIRLLNASYEFPFQWENRRAQKKHTDMFEVQINEGERYYRLSLGFGFDNDLKLSFKSMERMLYAVFSPYPNWEKQSHDILKQRQDKIRSIINDLRPKK